VSLYTQRTDLAWRRTVLTATITGLLAARSAALHWPAPLAVGAVAVIGLAVGAIALVGKRRGEVLADRPVRILTRGIWTAAAASLVITAIGLATVATVSP
jgi:hypothetical protein